MGLPVDNLEKCEQSTIVIDDSICEKKSISPQWFEKNDGKKREQASKGEMSSLQKNDT